MFTLFFSWYFIELPKKIYKIWVNYLWFFKRYFYLPELARTFLSPWKGLYFRRTALGLSIGEIVANFIFNNFSRGIGAFLRLIFLVIGGIFEILVAIFGILWFVLWACFPFALVFSLIMGIQLLI